MASTTSVQETKFIYYIDEEETPYLVKLNIAPEKVTLGDFKNALNRPHSKFFFKSIDDDFGVVKEEIFDDNAILPCFNGRVVSWLVTADESTISDSGLANVGVDGLCSKNGPTSLDCEPNELRTNSIPQPHTTAAPADSTSATLGVGGNHVHAGDTETESVHSANQDHIAPLRNFHYYKSGGRHHFNSNGTHGTYPNQPNNHGVTRHHRHHRHAPGSGTYEAPSSMLSSDLESTSFFDSEEESSRFSSITGTTLSSRRYGRARQRRRRRRPPPISRASSFSSITDSTMSLNVLAVTLNMDTVNFLGISIVGQSNKAGDGGIYVGSIMKGGAVAQDGRIQPGDMILEVNGISFEEMSNDDAVRTLREQVQHPGPITLVVAKCWDPNPEGSYFTIPRQEPVRPIDPRAWVLHTNAMTTSDAQPLGPDSLRPPVKNGASSGGESSSTLSPPGGTHPCLTPGMSMGTLTSGQTSMPLGTSAAAYNMAALLAASQQQQQKQQQEQMLQHQQQQQQQVQLPQPPFYPVPNMMVSHNYPRQITPSVVTASSSLPEIERYSDPMPLTLSTTIPTVIRAMLQPDSGLDIRDRVWLKLTVPNAFIGSDLVDWLYRHLDGLHDRREARKYAANLLKLGYIRHIVNKMTFSEQCYYVFRDLTGHMSCLSLEEVDSVSEVGALPVPNWGHNTTSTSLTVGPTNPAQPSSVPHGPVGEGNSSQYSSVPPLYHPALAAPIRQLIADGQNATAQAGLKVTHPGPRLLDDGRDHISGYSTSSSSTSSESNHFPSDMHNTSAVNNSNQHSNSNCNNNNGNTSCMNGIKSKPNDMPTSSLLLGSCFNHPKQQQQQQQQDQIQTSTPITRSQHPNSTPGAQLPQTSRSKQSFVGNVADNTAASSTASSSTSGGHRGGGVGGPTNVGPGSRHRTSSSKLDPQQLRNQDSVGGPASVISSKSSSSSSCAPGTTNQQHRLPMMMSTNTNHNGGNKNGVGGSQAAPPPPPPPRISTAASGFTLTSHQ